jgi:hypothetical protein
MNPQSICIVRNSFAVFASVGMSITKKEYEDYQSALAAYTAPQDTYATLLLPSPTPPPPPLVAPTTGHLSDDGHEHHTGRRQVTGPTEVD